MGEKRVSDEQLDKMRNAFGLDCPGGNWEPVVLDLQDSRRECEELHRRVQALEGDIMSYCHAMPYAVQETLERDISEMVVEIAKLRKRAGFEHYCVKHNYGWSTDEDGHNEGCPKCNTR